MTAPNLFLGSHATGELWAFGIGQDDAGEDYSCSAQTDPLQAGGPGLQAIFHGAYVWLRHRVEAADDATSYDEMVITVIAVVDDEDVAEAEITLRLTPISDRSNPPRFVRRQYEIDFFTAEQDGQAATIGLFPPGGSLFAIRVEWPAGPSEVAVDQVAVQREIVGESLSPENA